jgi:hypothetical protein
MKTSSMTESRAGAHELREEFDNFIGLIAASAVVIVLLLEWAK